LDCAVWASCAEDCAAAWDAAAWSVKALTTPPNASAMTPAPAPTAANAAGSTGSAAATAAMISGHLAIASMPAFAPVVSTFAVAVSRFFPNSSSFALVLSIFAFASAVSTSAFAVTSFAVSFSCCRSTCICASAEALLIFASNSGKVAFSSSAFALIASIFAATSASSPVIWRTSFRTSVSAIRSPPHPGLLLQPVVTAVSQVREVEYVQVIHLRRG
jgi:hypothetical protein